MSDYLYDVRKAYEPIEFHFPYGSYGDFFSIVLDFNMTGYYAGMKK